VNAPHEIANTVTEYKFKPESIVGEVPDCPQKYDLMSLIMINLGSKDKNYNGVIKMLDQLLVELEKDNYAVRSILENEYQIPFKKISEEALGMCNLSGGIYERGIDKGVSIGRDEGIAIGVDKGIIKGKVDTVKNMLKEGMALETALRFAGLDKETYEKFLNNND
jgi:hypothetical protein